MADGATRLAATDGRPRTGFGPVVLAGLASAVLAAVAGTRAWVEGTSGQLSTETAGDAAVLGSAVADGIGEMPLAGALSLVVLAGWGVVLVTRGRFRRIVMAVAALAAVGLLVTTVWALFTLQDSVGRAAAERLGAGHRRGAPHRLVRRRLRRRRRLRAHHAARRTPRAGLARDGTPVRRPGRGGPHRPSRRATWRSGRRSTRAMTRPTGSGP